MNPLYKAALVTAFGHGSSRPLTTALMRLGGLGITALALGVLLSNGLGETVQGVRNDRFVFTAIFVVQLAVVCILLGSLGITKQQRSGTFARWALTLPITPRERWLVLSVPSFALAMLALLLVAWPLATLFLTLGLPAILLPVAGVLGTLSAFGIAYGLPAHFTALQIALTPALLWLEYRLLTMIQTDDSQLFGICGFGAIVIATIWLFILSSRHARTDIARNARSKTIRTIFLPPVWWPSKKLWRSSTTRLSFIVTFGLAAGVSVVSNKQVLDPAVLLFMASLLAAAFAADIRSLSRRLKPAEITALRGTNYFALGSWAVAVFYSLLATFPLLWTAARVLDAPFHPTETAHILTQVLIGVTAGVLAGALVVPEPRDISGQFLATLLCLGILLGLGQLPLIRSLGGWQQVLCESILIGILGSLAIFVERRRNNYIWRKSRV